jgi:hypothetical protein
MALLGCDENGGMFRIATGVVLAIVGAIWILQGFNVAFAPGSFMTGDRFWSGTGVVAVIGGVGLVLWGVRSKGRSE